MAEGEETPGTLYKLTGAKGTGKKIGRIIVEGSTSNPIRFMDLNGAPCRLTEEEHADLARSYNLKKVSDENADRQAASEGESQQEDMVPQTEAEQQAAQAATAPGGGVAPVTTGRGKPRS